MSDASHAELSVSCTVGSAVCSATINTKYCYVSIATLSAFITLSTATDVLQQYKEKIFLRFHGKNCYTGAPKYYITSTQPSLVRLRFWNVFHISGSSRINFQVSCFLVKQKFWNKTVYSLFPPTVWNIFFINLLTNPLVAIKKFKKLPLLSDTKVIEYFCSSYCLPWLLKHWIKRAFWISIGRMFSRALIGWLYSESIYLCVKALSSDGKPCSYFAVPFVVR